MEAYGDLRGFGCWAGAGALSTLEQHPGHEAVKHNNCFAGDFEASEYEALLLETLASPPGTKYQTQLDLSMEYDGWIKWSYTLTSRLVHLQSYLCNFKSFRGLNRDGSAFTSNESTNIRS